MEFFLCIIILGVFWLYCRYLISMMSQRHKPVALKFFKERNIQIDLMSRRIIARFMDIHELKSLKRLFNVLENVGVKNIISICNESKNLLKITCKRGVLILNLRTGNDYKRIVVTRKFGEVYEKTSYYFDSKDFYLMSCIIQSKDMKITSSYRIAESNFCITLMPRLYKKTVYLAESFSENDTLHDFLSFEDPDILYPILCGRCSNLPQIKNYSPSRLAKG